MNNINQEIQDLEATLVSLKAKAEAQEPTLTPVSFESKGELAKALMDGRTFKTISGAILMYTDRGKWSSPFRVDQGPMIGAWASYVDLQEINAAPAEPWYLNIPEGGIECYVSDFNRNPFTSPNTTLITEYDPSLQKCFRFSGIVGWKYATPVNEGK